MRTANAHKQNKTKQKSSLFERRNPEKIKITT
jgi:hypothetical protein